MSAEVARGRVANTLYEQHGGTKALRKQSTGRIEQGGLAADLVGHFQSEPVS